jgi:regulator of replication initiation timing
MATKSTRSVDLEPIDRLEEKVRTMVGVLDRLRAEKAQALDENQRLTRELEAARARLAESDSVAAETLALREERDLIRTRVTDILEQLDALNL